MALDIDITPWNHILVKRKFKKPIIIISRCIEHDACRWNGLMISSPIVKKLKSFVEFVPICPEVEIGLGVPRKSIRVVESRGTRLLIQSESGRDVSGPMNEFVERFLGSVADADGFILKDRSPSCGNKDVKIYPPGEKVSPLTGSGSGFFGGAVSLRFGNLAVENEGRLNNLILREYFLTRLFSLASLRELKGSPAMGRLVQFHSENKLLLMSYNQKLMREMGMIVANRDKLPAADTVHHYGILFQAVFMKIPRFTSNINVLMHAMGYFSKYLEPKEKKHFLDILDTYRLRRIPLSTPVAVINSWIARFDEKYLAQQTYFSPFPDELVYMADSGKTI
jgi:uncharacterized protein YbgA (DUF1722 family)/uncharacterized protein YbbK (DUF523 family)